MPPSSPRTSWKRVMPCFATNSRTFFWLLAVLGDSAGTRWSKMIAIFDGSQIFGSRLVPWKTAWNWLRTRAAFSWDMARSTRGLDHVARPDRVTPGGPGQDLLDDRHSHMSRS